MHARIKLVSETEVHVATHAHYPDSYAVKIVNGEWFPTVEYAGVWDTAGLEALDLCISCFPQTGSFAALSDESATEFVGKQLRERDEPEPVTVVCIGRNEVLVENCEGIRTWVNRDRLSAISPPRPKMRKVTKQEFDELVHAGKFTTGPFIENLGSAEFLPYCPYRELWGELEDGTRIESSTDPNWNPCGITEAQQ